VPGPAGKRWLHMASTEAARQPWRVADYEACVAKVLARVPALAMAKACAMDAEAATPEQLQAAARELAVTAVQVHAGWPARGRSPRYCGALQRRLLEGAPRELAALLGPEGLLAALTPAPPAGSEAA
jgi:hypothetical protein